jgi:phage shock protein A
MMKAIRRLTTSIITSFESMISQVENHEALVESAIREVQETAARAHAQLGRLQRDGILMQNKIQDINKQITLWTERATKTASIDKNKAIECLKRKKRHEQEKTDLNIQIEQHNHLEKQLIHDLSIIEEKLGKLRIQRNALKTRQTRAQALGTLRQEDSALISELDDIFDRWEHKVSEYEYLAHCNKNSDALAEDFSNSEITENLAFELEQLLQKENL